MKVAMLSDFNSPRPVGLEHSYARAFEAKGHRVTTFGTTPRQRTTVRGVRDVDELQRIARAQAELQRKVLADAPDLVLIIKGRGVLASSVRAWRRAGVRVVNVFPDNPFEAAGAGLAGRAFLAQFRELDRIFVHDRFAVGQLRRIGACADFLEFARDPWMFPLSMPSKASAAPESVVFVGTPDEERIRYLRAIADLGLCIYGPWQRARLSPDDPLQRCVRGTVQLGPALVQSIQSAKLSINVLRSSQKTAHNMRTFEAPSCGVCVLSEASVGVQEIMAADREVVLFRSPRDLRSQVMRLLDSPDTIDAVARAGHARVEHETYERRVDQILAYL
jgi:glycosyltransferase involved in cell wall biosynthesis